VGAEEIRSKQLAIAIYQLIVEDIDAHMTSVGVSPSHVLHALTLVLGNIIAAAVNQEGGVEKALANLSELSNLIGSQITRHAIASLLYNRSLTGKDTPQMEKDTKVIEGHGENEISLTTEERVKLDAIAKAFGFN
jgi:hypothetical protein